MPALCRSLTICLNSPHHIDWRRRFRSVTRFRRKESQRVVAPIIAQTLIDEVPILHEGVHRHQFQRSNAHGMQVLDDGLAGHAGIGAAQMFGYLRMHLCHAAGVGFVDDGFVGRVTGRFSPLQSKVGSITQARARRLNYRTIVEGQIAAGISELISKCSSPQGSCRPIAFAYGSSSSLLGLKRMPLSGQHTDRRRGSRTAGPAQHLACKCARRRWCVRECARVARCRPSHRSDKALPTRSFPKTRKN